MERLTYRGSERMTEDGLTIPSYSDYSTRRIIERLAEYEDAEEQGLLLWLPCKVGDTVYKIINQRDSFDDTVYQIVSATSFKLSMIDKIGKTVFLTQAEAEQKLKEMESGEDNEG